MKNALAGILRKGVAWQIPEKRGEKRSRPRNKWRQAIEENLKEQEIRN